MLDQQTAENLLRNIFELWVQPEVERRRSNGMLLDSVVWAVQVLFHLDDSKETVVRLNDEVRAVAEVKVKRPIMKGEKVYEEDVDDIKSIRLTEEEDPNVAYIVAIHLKDQWAIFFDFRYNKALAYERLRVAEQFYEAAKLCYGKKLWRPFIDNLFSATELSASAQLLLLPDKEYFRKQTHNRTQLKYNALTKAGLYQETHKDNLNKLRGKRDSSRYLKTEFLLPEIEAKRFLQRTGEIIDEARKLISV